MTYDEAKDWILDNLEDYVPPKPRIGEFSKFVFPLISSVAAHGIVEDLVAVQPMALPSATVFYLDFVREPWWRRWWRKIISCRSSSVSRAEV